MAHLAAIPHSDAYRCPFSAVARDGSPTPVSELISVHFLGAQAQRSLKASMRKSWVGAGGPLTPADLAVEVGAPREDIVQLTRSFGWRI